MKIPVIVVSLVHIQGPLKGEIQELSKESIAIGRHPSNDVLFPKDLTIVSRNHAEIIREGNRFKLVDKSANGTFVNGKRVQETFLKDGDVIEFAEGGPKVSFLTEMKRGRRTAERRTRVQDSRTSTSGKIRGKTPRLTPCNPCLRRRDGHLNLCLNRPRRPTRRLRSPLAQHPRRRSHQDPRSRYRRPGLHMKIPVQTVAASLVIQYGPAVRSYRELPVTIGHHPKCGFVLEQPGILDQHAQIFFAQGRYWVKDLTGQALVQVNHQVVDAQTLLQVNDLVSLGPRGPVFRFVGEGRLAEAEEQTNESSAQAGPGASATAGAKPDGAGAPSPKGGLFSKIKKKKLF